MVVLSVDDSNDDDSIIVESSNIVGNNMRVSMTNELGTLEVEP